MTRIYWEGSTTTSLLYFKIQHIQHVISCSFSFTCSVASLMNILCPTSRRGRPFRRRLLFTRLPEPWREWSRLHLRWQDQHSGYHIPVQRRQVQEPRGKAKDLHFTGTCKRTPGQIHKNMGRCSCACFFFLMLYLKVHSSLKVQSKWACLRPSPGMPRRQAWRSSDCLWCRRQWAEDKWGGGGRQRRAHPSCWGWFHHVLLCGWRWVSWDV